MTNQPTPEAVKKLASYTRSEWHRIIIQSEPNVLAHKLADFGLEVSQLIEWQAATIEKQEKALHHIAGGKNNPEYVLKIVNKALKPIPYPLPND